MLIPTFTLAEIVTSMYQKIKMWERVDFTQPMRYYSCATLDERAIPASDIDEQLQLEQAPRVTATKLKAKELNEDSIPLHHIYCESLVCEHEPFNARSFTRPSVLSLSFLQGLMTKLL